MCMLELRLEAPLEEEALRRWVQSGQVRRKGDLSQEGQ